MSAYVDLAIVSTVLGGSALYMVRRFFKKSPAACTSGCGSCGDDTATKAPEYRTTPLVALTRPRAK